MIDACDNCVRRSHLLARLAPHIEHAAIDRPGRRAPELLALDDAALVAAVGGSRRHEILAAHRAAHPAELRRRAASAGCWAVCRHASGYPEALRDLGREAPAALFGCGALDVVRGLDPGTVVTIVGARRASAYGLGVGEQLARLLGAAGLGVVSGMANGIDSRAHAGALDGGGRTVAVLGGGADVPYPKRQARLHRRIRAEGGAVVSEMPPGTASFRWSFPARNRLMAALSRITVVVEAAERSGSLITATMALELGRDVGAVPGPVNAWLSAGTNQLLADGAEVVRDAQDVLDHLLGAGRCNLRELGPEIDAGLREVLERVEGGETTCDAVALAGGRPAHEVSSALARLELLGYLTSDHTGRYSRTPLVAGGGRATTLLRVSSEITYALLFRIAVKRVDTFERYESLVLPLLDDHGGRLERRLRSPDRLTEVHIVSFPSREAFTAYREDPRRGEHTHLLAESGAAVEMLEVDDA